MGNGTGIHAISGAEGWFGGQKTPANVTGEDMKKPRILIVSEAGADELKTRLESLGFEVAGVVANGRDAGLMAEHAPVDLALLDLGMAGDERAIDLARQLRDRWQIPAVYLKSPGQPPETHLATGESVLSLARPLENRELQLALEFALYKRRAEEKLWRSQERFRQLVDSTHDWVWEVDPNGVYTFCSPQIREILGYEPAELLGRTPFDFMPPEEASRVRLVFTQLAARRQPFQGMENINRHKAGHLVVLNTNGVPLFDEKGRFQGYRGMDRNVSPVKAMEARILESEKWLKALLNNIKDPAWFTNVDGQFLAVNEAWCQLFGLQREAAVGKNSRDLLAPELADRFLAEDRELIRTRTVLRQEEMVATQAGESLWFETIKSPLFNDHGEVIGITGIARDITARHRAEQALRLSESRLRESQAIGHVGSFHFDARTHAVWWSDEMYRILGRPTSGNAPTLDEIKAMTHPEDTAHWEDLIAEAVRENRGVTMENRVSHPDGTCHYISVLLSVKTASDGRPLEVAGTVQDITERKRVEQALRENEQKYRELVENANSIILRWGPDGKIRFLNEFGLRFFGYTEAEIIGRHVMESIVPDYESTGRELQSLMEQICANPRQFENNVNENIRRNGERVWVAWTNKIVLDEQGRAREILSIGSDITERKRAAEELFRSQERLNLALQSAKMGVFEWNLAENQRIWDDNVHQLIGIPKETFTGKLEDLLPAIHPEDQVRVRDTLEKAIQQGDTYELEYRVACPEEEWRHISERGRVARDASGKAVKLTGVCWDVTATKCLQDQLRQAQKMEAVGQLAGGVAHDFNNILTGIMMNAYLLRGEGRLTDTAAGLVAEMEHSARRAANLTRQLLLYSRRQAMQFKGVDLNQVLENLLKMLRRLLGENNLLVFEPGSPGMRIEADAGMMEQVVTNLCVNARDAMPSGGKILLQTSQVEIDAKHARGHEDRRPGRFVCLAVSDTGCGIAEANLKHIFEPFFTTKEVGKGSGLGLATVYGIVKQHNGWVQVESGVGQGTVFRVYLPACADAQPGQAAPPAEALVSQGRETILVVEDEPLVRQTVGKYLRLQGYRIFEAGNGMEALSVWKQHSAEIQLLFTDVVMPEGMSGLELADRLMREKPQLRIIVGTGYSDAIVRNGVPTYLGIQFLGKPYEPGPLGEAIRKALDQGR